ncbi:similar to Saccharomyces cerevisiae YOR296W Putative protein of unknown function [Maudiozyma barnettii]|uniref:C2 domain-containing protein n=1 Tax=Maudiozyma barnettii TaxID=61262 RepID=A0A8H2VCU8_9SACH|nr:hypothetical protein [Kazachstania barnettii]CAB4252928.1 similar to Saccharomyces cerevisiae YOR296W Putative protein of unknown function [Kazachstania barnettii]CAD1780723.1 similar to Saccharomyces cerevisiae YOR296W Putative protein of unknown function [Kazachstania barnettii]
MKRITSTTSTSLSHNNNPDIPSVKDSYSPAVSPHDLYSYSLKLLILEYINEPRFQSSKSINIDQRQSSRERYGDLNNGRITRLGSGGNNIIKEEKNDDTALALLKGKLELYLNKVTINQVGITNQDYRRSLMKYYNDYYLNPTLRKTTDEIIRPEDMIVYFSKTASNQLTKFQTGNFQYELYNQISKFIFLLIELANASQASSSFIKRLEDYERSLKSPGPSIQAKRACIYQESNIGSLEDQANISGTLKNIPTFRLEQVTHSSYFAEIFDVDPLTLQQDIIKISKYVNNDQYCRELRQLSNSVKNDKGPLVNIDFSSNDDYELWKSYILNEMNILFKKYETRSVQAGQSSETFEILPKNPRDMFTALMVKVFAKDCNNQSTSLKLTQDALFFLSKYSKYWMVDYYSTLASLIYTSMTLTVLGNEQINVPLAENLFSMIDLKILTKDVYKNTSIWNDGDQKQWIINMLFIEEQCMNSLDNLLSGLFTKTKPKFSPILSFYYTYIETDPAIVMFKKYTDYTNKNAIRRLKKTIFKCAEIYYISLLDTLPKDKFLELHHIQEVGESLLQSIKDIQKRYTKPLLDKINIAFISAEMLITAYATDFPSMIKRAERYYKINNNESIAPVNALELYSLLKELRDIYIQVQTKRQFPFDLENMFYKYMRKIIREIIKNIKGVIITSLKNERWERINNETPFSHSVLDIFKMVNESIELIINLGWGNFYQLATAFTLILKALSDDIKIYSQSTLKLIQKDLRQSSFDALKNTIEDHNLEERVMGSDVKDKKRWTFHEMKKALMSQPEKRVIPPTFEYREGTCVMLNDLETMIKMVNELDEKLEPECISQEIENGNSSNDLNDKNITDLDVPLHQVYSIRVVEAKDIRGYGKDGMSNVSVSLRCSTKQRESGMTRVIPKTTNPIWDEEFEIQLPFNSSSNLTFNVWHHSSSKLKAFTGDDICGRANLTLDPKHFTDDGFPNSRTLDLDTQGQLYIQISLETEKYDALFSFGRSYRLLSRSRDRAVELLVDKFSSYVSYSISRQTLQSICDNTQSLRPTDDSIYDAIVPLFDYLNSNLTILATQLTDELLIMVMLKAWFSILKTADNLLLPQLSIAKNKLALTKNSLWKHDSTALPGYGRPLTIKEVEIVFNWLDALCIDFFYNNGEGPPLQDLKNKDYQKLLLIPAFYDKSSAELKKEIQRLTPSYYKFIEKKYRDNNPNIVISRKLTSVERRKTIMKTSFRKTKEQLDREASDDCINTLERDSELLDIILRILISKNETDFVYQHLHERKLKRKMIAITSIADKVSKGHRVKYKK